jgi:diguanylate cyclase (GGDEF)-like protein
MTTTAEALMNRSNNRPPRRPFWALIAGLLALVGVATSTVGSIALADAAKRASRQQFTVAANEVVASLKLVLQHEDDLGVNAAAFVASHPHVGNEEFTRWAESVRAAQRYPEVAGVGLVEVVQAAELPAYWARMAADPLHPGEKSGQITPPGKRPYYCLPVFSFGPGDDTAAGFDFCGVGISHLTTRDSGAETFDSFPVDNTRWLGVGMPVYTTGSTPATVEERRRAFVGWLGESIVPSVVLNQALAGHPGYAVTYQYRGQATAEFHSGLIPRTAQRETLDVGYGWRATVSGPALSGDLAHNGPALAVLLSGIAVSTLMSVLLFVLATGRSRARQMVEVRTHQLRHQATHDPLTGLPNRALIMDRVAQAVANAQRNQNAIAVMFLDLDGFKKINDKLGHAAGDQLLKEVSRRLHASLRTGDTVGRLGGDEFVVLLESGGADSRAGAEKVANRIRAELAVPVELKVDTGTVAVPVHTSIGIATGVRDTADELLHDADIAMYEAKRAGRDRYVIFTPESPAPADVPERAVRATAKRAAADVAGFGSAGQRVAANAVVVPAVLPVNVR